MLLLGEVPMPPTFLMSSMFAKVPYCTRQSMMAFPFDGPMPLSVCSVAESAVLIFIKSAACTIKAAGAAHSSTMATSLVSFIRLIYAQHVAQDFCRHFLFFWRRSNAAQGVFKRRGSGRLPACPRLPVGQGRGGFRRVRNTRERFL